VNQTTGLSSKKLSHLYSKGDRRLSEDGLRIYLNFGYAAFGLTPIEDIHFVQPNEAFDPLRRTFSKLKDPWKSKSGKVASPEKVIENIRNWVNNWEESFDGEIIIPLSSGLDSRLLLWAIKDKSRVRTFTYGLNDNKNNSIDVLAAKSLSSRMGVRWEQIQVTDYHSKERQWVELYDVAVHAHGMYQIAFYEQIKNKVSHNARVLSGIVGDLWAGSVNVPAISEPSQLVNLGLSRGMNAPQLLGLSTSEENKKLNQIAALQEFFMANEEHLKCPKFRVLTLVRTKMQLLRYLTEIPTSLGLKTESPFLSQEIGFEMLSISEEDRLDRTWQKKFFESENLNDQRLRFASTKNLLNISEVIEDRLNLPDIEKITSTCNELAIKGVSEIEFYRAFSVLQKKRGKIKKIWFRKFLSTKIFSLLFFSTYKFTGKQLDPVEKILRGYLTYLCISPFIRREDILENPLNEISLK
jgi:hypothetical protein